jgi:hypothetical protein
MTPFVNILAKGVFMGERPMPIFTAQESRLPIDEIETLLIQRNAPIGTQVYIANFTPTWLSSSTICFTRLDSVPEVLLTIRGKPLYIDLSIRRSFMPDTIELIEHPLDEPSFFEESVLISRNLSHYTESRLSQLDVLNLPQPPQKLGTDGMVVEAKALIIGKGRIQFSDWSPTDKHWQYFWILCRLAMKVMDERRSLKYLIALQGWLKD